jgi:chitin disaccharide deacetylase
VKRLILNADDFGLTAGVNRAILSLNKRNALTSATLMAVAHATLEAASFASNSPQLGVGCHVVLVDGLPALPPAQLPTLVDQETGRFRPTLGRFVRDLFLGRIHAGEIEAESEAQIAHLRTLGVRVTHVDTHKHTHIFPRVLAPLLEAAKRQQILAIRNPFEPAWSISATSAAPMMRRAQVRVLNGFRAGFRSLVGNSGLATTDGAVGVLATGTLDAAALTSLLRALPNGTWELVTHPGHNDADLAQAGTRLLASREIEFAALSAVSIAPDVELIHFGQLAFGQPVRSESP